MKKNSRFLRAYFVFLAVCIVLAIAFLIYVFCIIRQYDNAQPERIVQSHLETLRTDANQGALTQKLNLAAYCSNRYEELDANAYIDAYCNKIKLGNLSYTYQAGESSELTKTYAVFSDQDHVGDLTIQGKNNRTHLFFFSMADWSVEQFVPAMSNTVYQFTLFCPENVQVLINGIAPSEEERDPASDIPAYQIRGLLTKPTITYSQNGKEIAYITDKNNVMPALYDYRIAVPDGITVMVNGTRKTAENGIVSVMEMTNPDVVLQDAVGNQCTYSEQYADAIHQFSITVLQSQKVTIAGVDADTFAVKKETQHPEAQQLLKQANLTMPAYTTYEFALLTAGAIVEISDDNGILERVPLKTNELNRFGTPLDTIPDQFDAMAAALCWSKFMTDDLNGEKHGLYVINQYLIQGSDYAHYAEQWATGVDIGFTSKHIIDSFTNQKISNITSYGEHCFSCDIYFEKNMSLLSYSTSAGKRTDVFNSTIYFVFLDDTPDNGIDDPHWAIAVMREIV